MRDSRVKLLLIDNYDSFTFNLYQLFGELGADQTVLRNDALSTGDVIRHSPDAIVISPGPGTPADSGVSRAVIRNYAGRLPILGVCLGMQCIAEVYGGRVDRAGAVMHGKTSLIEHNGTDIFEGIPSPCEVARYHSLAVYDLPGCLDVTATAGEGRDSVVMGLKHRDLPLWGVQFHPESFLTEHGSEMMQNFLNKVGEYEESLSRRTA